jgi:hypothetical protein
MQGGCFYREELYHTREKCKGGGGSVGDPKGQGGGPRYFRKSNVQNSMYVVV